MNEHPENQDGLDIDSGRTDDFEFEKLAKKYSGQDTEFVTRTTDPANSRSETEPYKDVSAAGEASASAASGAAPAAGRKKNPNGAWQKISRSPYFYGALVLVVSVFISVYGIICMNDILAINKNAENVTLTLGGNMTTGKVIDLLHENKLIKSKLFCKLYAKVLGYTDKYSQGVFYLNGKMGLEGMLLAVKDRSNPEETVSVTIPEGFTIMQVIDRLSNAGVCSRESLIAALNTKVETSALASAIPNDSRKFFALEGYLFPDTYDFYIGQSANDVINTFLKRLENKVTAADREKAKQLGMTMDEVITMASIIEKEAAGKSQMAGISAVLHNRLNKETQYPQLQCDSTLSYLSNTIGPNLNLRPGYTLQYYQDNYSTYQCTGLPAGPICNPGYDAIKAALNPSSSRQGYYYFYHNVRTGEIYYARTNNEHNNNIARVRRENSDDI